MNENIDLTKILDGCPEGTVFYSSIHDEVKFLHIDKSLECPIVMVYNNDYWSFFGKDARMIPGRGERALFPSKDQRDWSKFVRFWDKKFDPKTLKPFDRVLVRDSSLGCWHVDFFGFIDIKNKFVTCGSIWKIGIPYNDETKHLVGTNDDCPKYYKWWEE